MTQHNPANPMTLPELKRELATLEAQRRKLKRAIKAAQPKARKVRDPSERERAAKYVDFREKWCVNNVCWFCEIGNSHLDRAHITNDGLSKRLEDVRLIAALCRDCHNAHTAGRIATSTLIRLKRERDPENWDPEFLQKHSVRRLEFPK